VTSWDTIAGMYRERKEAAGPLLAKAMEIRDHYNGEVVVPLPEMDKAERPFVANQLLEAVDQQGMRISSTLPDCFFPPVRPGIKASENKARDRRRAVLGWWQMNRMGIKLRRRARWLIAYASAPAYICPDFRRGIPRWEPIDPLAVYPAPTADPDDLTPPDVIWSVTQPLGWIRAHYPGAANVLVTGPDPKPHDRYTLIRYADADELILGLLGKVRNQFDPPEWGQLESIELERTENRAGICPVVVPGRVTLDKRIGQYDGLPGVFQAQAKAMALWMIGVQKGIFPDRIVEGRAGEEPNITSGPHDGRTGLWNIVTGGQVKDLTTNPTYLAPQLIDRLERTQRLEGGIPAEYGGEAASNVRTGRRAEQILSGVVNFPVQEAQTVLAEALREENVRAIAVARGYFDTPRSFYVSWPNAKGRVDYIPSDTFETAEHTVSFSLTGTDANNLRIITSQGIGVGTLSKLHAMQVDPLVEDWEWEQDQIVYEGLQTAILGGISQQLAAGTIPVTDGARIMELVRSDKMDLAAAVAKVQQEAQERQAQQAPAGSPETQPGIAQPGMGAEAGAAIPQGPPSLGNLSMLMRNLRGSAQGAAQR
jgi:hypothetical protein